MPSTALMEGCNQNRHITTLVAWGLGPGWAPEVGLLNACGRVEVHRSRIPATESKLGEKVKYLGIRFRKMEIVRTEGSRKMTRKWFLNPIILKSAIIVTVVASTIFSTQGGNYLKKKDWRIFLPPHPQVQGRGNITSCAVEERTCKRTCGGLGEIKWWVNSFWGQTCRGKNKSEDEMPGTRAKRSERGRSLAPWCPSRSWWRHPGGRADGFDGLIGGQFVISGSAEAATLTRQTAGSPRQDSETVRFQHLVESSRGFLRRRWILREQIGNRH